jgi:hypothetical protein
VEAEVLTSPAPSHHLFGVAGVPKVAKVL